MNIARRGFLAGIISSAAAPLIVRSAGVLMPIKPALVAGPQLVKTFPSTGLVVGDFMNFTLPGQDFADVYVVTAVVHDSFEFVKVA